MASLLGSGADINAKDKKQYTPLHSAAAGGQAITVKLLVELGADVSEGGGGGGGGVFVEELGWQDGWPDQVWTL